jgi:hypothetical protein
MPSLSKVCLLGRRLGVCSAIDSDHGSLPPLIRDDILTNEKGLVQRRQGHMQASLVTFQRLMQLYPNNVETAKQVARSL